MDAKKPSGEFLPLTRCDLRGRLIRYSWKPTDGSRSTPSTLYWRAERPEAIAVPTAFEEEAEILRMFDDVTLLASAAGLGHAPMFLGEQLCRRDICQ
jgi:hypothetical protein